MGVAAHIFGLALGAVLLAPSAMAGDGWPDGPIRADALYPEGPLIHEGVLYYAEMTADRVTIWDGQGRRPFFELEGCGPTSISPFGDRHFAVTCHLADAVAIVASDGRLERLIEVADNGEPLKLPNDSYTDRRGGVYFSSSGPFAIRLQPSGRIFHLSADGKAREVAQGLYYANGVFVSEARILYVSEHMGRRILRYRIADNADLTPLEPLADIVALMPELAEKSRRVGPDGLEVTASGTVFVAIYGAGRILQISSVSTVQKVYDAGLPFVTNLALDLEHNRMIVTGAFSNTVSPLRGEVHELALGQ